MNLGFNIRSMLNKQDSYIILTVLSVMTGILIIIGMSKFMIYTLFVAIFLLFLDYIIQKKKGYVTVILFSLLLISPLIPTGLPLKKYTRLNEMFLIVSVIILFASNAVRGKSVKLNNSEGLLCLIGISLLFSTCLSYLLLDVIPTLVDFYCVFNIGLFCLYFRFGTFFEYKNKNVSVMLKMLFISVLALNIISISQIFPWGFKNVLPLYVPEGYSESIGYQQLYEATGTIGRIPGIIASPTSFSIILVIIVITISGWIVYMPVRHKMNSLLIKALLILSTVTLVLTFSRSGLLALIISMIYLFRVARFKDKRNISTIMMSYILASVLLVTPLLYLDKLFNIPLSSLRGFRLSYLISGAGDMSYTIKGEGVSDIENRLNRWKRGIIKGVKSPIFGWGPANANRLQGNLLKAEKRFPVSHNEYIEIFVQTGLVGLVLLFSFFVSVFRKAGTIAKNSADEFSVYIARSVRSIIVALAIFDLGDGFWFNPIIPSILMIIFGAMYAAGKNSSALPIDNIKIKQLRA